MDYPNSKLTPPRHCLGIHNLSFPSKQERIADCWIQNSRTMFETLFYKAQSALRPSLLGALVVSNAAEDLSRPRFLQHAKARR